jgi:membrane protease YdiL (CAAX protease family)
MQEKQGAVSAEPVQIIWSLKDLLLILLGILFIFGIISAAIGLVFRVREVNPEELLKPSIEQSLGLASLEALSLIGSVYFLGIRRKGLTWRSLGFQSVPRRWILAALLATAVAIPLSSLITIIVLIASGMPLENPQLDFLLPGDIAGPQILAMILMAGIIAPIAEEIVFRGVLYRFIRDRWGILWGVVLSSLIFAIVHADLAVGTTALLLGFILAVFYEYSHSLWTAVLIHAVNNSARLTLLYLVVKFGVLQGL